MKATQPATPHHPAPERHQTNWLLQLIGLAGAPASWIALISINYIVASNACYPHRKPLPEPLWQGMDHWLLLFDAAFLITGALSGMFSYTMWRRTRHEAAGTEKHAVDSGIGRTRFLAMLGVMSSSLFCAAILFTSCANIIISPCRPWLQP